MTEKRQLDALTGLRFVAALTVFVHHLGGKFSFLMNPYSIGSLAVTFFFVLSGFILTYVYHDGLSSFSDLRRFFFNRFARIWPLHVLCLILSIIVFSNGNILWNSSQLSLEKLVANLCLLQSWVPHNEWVFSFNGVSWSISVECFFYAVFPLLMYGGFRKFGLRAILTFVIIGISILVLNQMSQSGWGGWDYYRVGHVNPLVRLPEFCLGVVAGKFFCGQGDYKETGQGILWFDSVKELICIAAIVGAAILVARYRLQFFITEASWGSAFLGSWFRVVYPVLLFAITIYVFANSRGVLARFCGCGLMVYLGEISYAFYMVHLLVVRNIVSAYVSYGQLSGVQISAVAFGVSLGCAVLLYELVEMPAKRKLLRMFRGGQTANTRRGRWVWPTLRVLGSIAMVLACIYTLISSVPNRNRTPEIAKVIESARGFESVDFGSHYRLLAFEPVSGTKNLKLEMVWVKRIKADYRRLVFLLDENGMQIGRALHNQLPFKHNPIGQEFLDDVYVPKSKLAKTYCVVLSFRKKGQTPLLVLNGSERQRSLVLMNREQIEEALLEDSAKPGM